MTKFIDFKIFIIAIIFMAFTTTAWADGTKEHLFAKGQELINQKSYTEAIQFIDDNIHYFESEKDAPAMVEFLNLKGKAYTHQYQFDEGVAIYRQVAELAKKHQLTQKYAEALGSVISILNFKGDYDESMRLCREILSLEGLDKTLISNTYTFISSIYTNKGMQDSCIFYAQKAVDIDLELDDHSSLPFSISTLAKGYENVGYNQKALELYLQGMTYLRPGVDDFKMATFNRFIGTIFLRLNNFTKAEEYIDKSIAIAEEKNIILTSSYSKFVKATILQQNQENNQAKLLLEEILALYLDKDRKDLAVECYSWLGIIALEQDDVQLAQKHITDGEKLFLKINNGVIIYDLLFAQARLARYQQNFSEAEQALLPLITNNLLENNPRLKIRYLKEMIEIKKGKNDFEEALSLVNKKTELEKETNLIQQEFLIAEMEAKYNKIEDAKKIEKLHDDNQIKSLLVQKRNSQLVGSLLFLLLAIIGGGFILKQNNKIKSMVEELKTKNEKIATSLLEKEILLKEIHHRVKNNLQIVSSLLNMQSRDVEEQTAKDALNESKNRVHSMAMIHQELYQLKTIIGINSKTYIEKLTKNLVASYQTHGGEITMVNNIDNINLDVDTSIPLGLIINELVTNSLKYAFPNQMNGKIELTLRQHDDYLLLSVADNGIGIDASDKNSVNSFGLKMIRIFAKKLNAEWEILKDNGTIVSLKIKNFKIA